MYLALSPSGPRFCDTSIAMRTPSAWILAAKYHPPLKGAKAP